MKLSLPMVGVLLLLTAIFVVLGANLFDNHEGRIRSKVEHAYAISDPQFVRTVGVLLGPALVDGNKVETLINGDQIFPAMLGAIRSARKSINFETYIYWSGAVGKEFADALSERGKAGVKVRILLDWAGSQKIDKAVLDELTKSGVEIQKYHPLHWYTLDRLNNRTHRKLLVVDGSVGFTGGVGIADNWSGNAQDPDHWRDTHFRVEGPVVAQMQAAFADNWMKVSGDVMHGNDYLPPAKAAGPLYAQMFKSSSDGGAESMHLMYLLSIAAATRSIDLSMAYFVPDEMALDALEAALKRGVKLRIIMPGKHTDSSVVRRASRATWGSILRAGAELYEYEPTMYHCKVLIVDRLWVSVGSTNFDSRSFRLNDEANLNIYDADFAALQSENFERDLAKSRRVTLQEWETRPLSEKAWEGLMSLMGSQL